MLLSPATIGAIQQDPIRRIFKQASLDLRFADNKSLVDATTGQNLVTFTRASSGTFVGSNGVLQTAVTNLLLQSEDLSNAAWSKAEVTVATDATAAPNGAITADQLTPSTTSAGHTFSRPGIIGGAGTFTDSVHAKANGYNFLVSTADSGGFVIYDLSNGTINSSSVATGLITAAGNGWYRCSTTRTTTAAATVQYQIRATAGTFSYAGNGTSGLFIWGAQLEQAATAGEYIPTTSTINSAPRFDHNPTTGESLGLLVEEQRTNLCLYSQAITTAPWAANGTETCAASTLTDPAGGLNAFKINTPGTGAFERWQQPITVVNGTTYTLSAFVRSTTGTVLFRLRFGGGVTSSDLTATTTWQRFSFTITSGTTAGFFAFNASTTGAATEIHVYGAQLEAGAFPTSYIPTTTAAATRSADVASITGSAFTGFYRQDEGTVFVNATTNATHGGSNAFPRKVSISDGTNNNTIEEYYRVLASYTDAGYRIAVAGVDQAQFDTNNQRNGQSIVIGYAANNYAFAVGGTVVNTDLSGTVPTTTQLRLGQRGDGSLALNGTIRRLSFWPTRLPNNTLQTITQ